MGDNIGYSSKVGVCVCVCMCSLLRCSVNIFQILAQTKKHFLEVKANMLFAVPKQEQN